MGQQAEPSLPFRLSALPGCFFRWQLLTLLLVTPEESQVLGVGWEESCESGTGARGTGRGCGQGAGQGCSGVTFPGSVAGQLLTTLLCLPAAACPALLAGLPVPRL